LPVLGDGRLQLRQFPRPGDLAGALIPGPGSGVRGDFAALQRASVHRAGARCQRFRRGGGSGRPAAAVALRAFLFGSRFGGTGPRVLPAGPETKWLRPHRKRAQPSMRPVRSGRSGSGLFAAVRHRDRVADLTEIDAADAAAASEVDPEAATPVVVAAGTTTADPLRGVPVLVLVMLVRRRSSSPRRGSAPAPTN